MWPANLQLQQITFDNVVADDPAGTGNLGALIL